MDPVQAPHTLRRIPLRLIDRPETWIVRPETSAFFARRIRIIGTGKIEWYLDAEGPMPIYVVRLNDGSCLIGEADSESQARDEFLSRWDEDTGDPEFILSVREMPKGTFLSRWWLSEVDPEDGGVGDLDGVLNENNDIYRNEYPMIEVVNKHASEEMENLSNDPEGAEKLDDWDYTLGKRLQGAARAEMRRGSSGKGPVQ